jgi:hypothetical protein
MSTILPETLTFIKRCQRYGFRRNERDSRGDKQLMKKDKHITKVLELFDREIEKYPDLKFSVNRLRMAGAFNVKSFITTAILEERERIARELEGKKRTLDEQAMDILKQERVFGENYYNKAISDAQEVVKGA